MLELILLFAFIVWLVCSVRSLPHMDFDDSWQSGYPYKLKKRQPKREEKVKEDFFMRE